MAKSYDVIGFSSDTTAEKFDRIAVENAFSGRAGTATAALVQQKGPQARWGTRVINRQGMGNHGSIVLVGLTPRTRALVRQGKTHRLVGLAFLKSPRWRSPCSTAWRLRRCSRQRRSRQSMLAGRSAW